MSEDLDSSARNASSKFWLAPTLTAILALAGIGALVAALLVLTRSDDESRSEPVEPSPTTAPSVAAPSISAADVADRPVDELADAAWVSEMASAAQIPERALRAYAGAAIAVSRSHPDCHLGWNTLAAIGWVESEHATMNGALLADDGSVAPQIIGITLNGEAGVDAIADTDGGELDGDTEWDHALGPMQFLPSTWDAFAVDGDGDGTPDVHQIDDAALTAAVYLCESGGDLGTPEGWIAAVNAYNPSVDYNRQVAQMADQYATFA